MRQWLRLSRLGKLGGAVSLALVAMMALAQQTPEACITLVQGALRAADQLCTETGRNQVCYGNVLNVATPFDGVDDFAFESAGDIEHLLRVQALELSPFDEALNQWGVALMKLQATLPDSLPGQNVTFILFGDTSIEADTGVQGRAEGTARTAANIRIGPNDTSPIVGSLSARGAVVVTGQYTNSLDELWLRVRFEDYRTKTGWVLGDLVDADLTDIPAVTADSLTYSPMQAFYFRTGIGRPSCAAAPADGVVVQTPAGAGKVSFTVNGIEIAMGSTAYINSRGDVDQTCVSLISGDADLRSAGILVNLNPGESSCSRTPDHLVQGPPGPVRPFDAEEIALLEPVLELLPEDVTIPPPAVRRTPTPVESDVPASSAPGATPGTGGSPVVVATPGGPTVTPGGPSRFVSAGYSRNYFTANFTANAGPDAPSTINWNFGDGTFGGGVTASHTYAGPATYGALVEACWSDGFCLQQPFGVDVPPCAIDFSSFISTIQFNFTGTSESFDVGRKDEWCNPSNLAVLDSGNTTYSSGVYLGEHWYAVDRATSAIVYEVTVPDANPIVKSLP
ncbi:MAG: SH3 domain-containing protein [Chloroflexi bacterium]|nr:SH3 domain-containing protein [Chloroflexota bacterium]